MDVIKIEEKDFFEKVLKSEKKVLVDFYADWCGPCRMLSPVIEEVAKEFDDTQFYKINVDNAEEIARKYGVMSIPTIILFKNGELLNKEVGFKTKSELKEFLEK